MVSWSQTNQPSKQQQQQAGNKTGGRLKSGMLCGPHTISGPQRVVLFNQLSCLLLLDSALRDQYKMDKSSEMHTEDADLAIQAFCQDWRRFVCRQDNSLFSSWSVAIRHRIVHIFHQDHA